MKNCAQVSMFEVVNNAITEEKPKSRSKDNGKRKTKGWAPKKAKPTVDQSSLGFEKIPLNNYDWSEDYQIMHEQLLTQSLAPCLGGNVSMDYLNEIINWVIAPKFKEDSDLIQPFSFQACCIASGVDSSDMQEQIFPQLQSALDKAMKN